MQGRRLNPWTFTVAIWVQLWDIKHSVPDRVKPSCELLTSGHSDTQPWASECPGVKNYTNDGLTRSQDGNWGRQRVNCSSATLRILWEVDYAGCEKRLTLISVYSQSVQCPPLRRGFSWECCCSSVTEHSTVSSYWWPTGCMLYTCSYLFDAQFLTPCYTHCQSPRVSVCLSSNDTIRYG